MSPLAASLEFCLCPTARRIPARRSLGAIPHTYGLTSERLSFVRRTPRACHGACDRLRPRQAPRQSRGLLGVSLAPTALCARKEEADIECVSTTGSILEESLVMRGDFFDTQTVPFGIYATSRHCIPRCSPRNSKSEETANNGAAENCSARHGSCYSYSGVSRSVEALSHVRCLLLRATPQLPRSAVSELESLGVSSRLVKSQLLARFFVVASSLCMAGCEIGRAHV